MTTNLDVLKNNKFLLAVLFFFFFFNSVTTNDPYNLTSNWDFFGEKEFKFNSKITYRFENLSVWGNFRELKINKS